MTISIAYIYSQLTISGGTDRILTDKANYLANHGYDVTIITESQMGRPLVYPLSSKVKLIDIGLDYEKQYGHNLIYRLFLYTRYSILYKRKLSAILNRIKPDIVITLMGRSLDFITTLNDGSIKIGEAHTTKDHLRSLHLLEQRGGFYRWMARNIRKKLISNAKKLSALVLLTPEDSKDWCNTTKTYIIPNFIDTFPKFPAELNNKKAIIVGRYNDSKGYEYLVEAWKIVNQRHPDWVIDIYGAGELHDDVERWIHDAFLHHTMIMHDPTNAIMQKYLESSICIISSRYEGFSMVIIEAMASGVPCVSFDCPFGPRNIIKDREDGILVDYLNPRALADNICMLIENDELRKKLGHQARENIQRFSKDCVMKQWEKLFTSLISHKKE